MIYRILEERCCGRKWSQNSQYSHHSLNEFFFLEKQNFEGVKDVAAKLEEFSAPIPRLSFNV